MKKQNGITLIALVITIIVLLILAGVSINLVLGENGVLNKSQNAVSSTKTGQAKEQVVLAWGSCDTDYLVYGRGQGKSTYFTTSKLTENLSEGEITEVSYGINAAKDSELAYKAEEGYYKMKVTAAGEVSVIEGPTPTAPTLSASILQTLASQIDKDNYGDYVNYNRDLDLTLKLEGDTELPKTDWRIFYEDTIQDRVYLIAADYVPNTSAFLKSSALGMTPYGKYSLGWATTPSSLSTTTRQDSIFGRTASSYALNASEENSRCVSYLLDTAHWNNFVDTSVADYAIGGPTLEMFANSWNEQGYSNLAITSASTGYRINGGYSTKVSGAGYDDNLYFTHKTEIGSDSEKCYSYWLCAPVKYDDLNIYAIICAECEGDLNLNGTNTGEVSVRPVIALKSGVIGTQDANGVWQLGE